MTSKRQKSENYINTGEYEILKPAGIVSRPYDEKDKAFNLKCKDYYVFITCMGRTKHCCLCYQFTGHIISLIFYTQMIGKY